jgi:hypothetical protein
VIINCWDAQGTPGDTNYDHAAIKWQDDSVDGYGVQFLNDDQTAGLVYAAALEQSGVLGVVVKNRDP